ncbi:polyprenol phosphomannose-dependent alpha 1,6 mannosyltransferase MptB [Nocardioides bruguierae]|uniref:Polyprenol phosphomannose-dependent alpha 1,6 mannosyltransferase MptB n=1 Tax=Nocardioides bruguierae TaxID=2945102 RepID=A0A9X2D7Z2_9ACTN|nr:polyprenol phosphomannose-dependent alpha 1,6 mannosyltransferase MptB [Nocardioides bruguierae]MCM0620836.1 polyprenol phosphomannose-dependent alpha 1,6 mannosyltransferase MptB [Nocardioides bruguierae]
MVPVLPARLLARGLVGSVLVLLGGLVVSTLPRSTPLLEVQALVALREAMPGRLLGVLVVLVGMGLLAGAWLSLCRSVAVAEEDEAGDALSLVRTATLLWSVPLLLAPPLFSRDGWSYAAQGMLVHLGQDPYEVGPGVMEGPIIQAVDPRWMGTATPYGPVPLAWGDLLAGQTESPWALVMGHRVLALVGLVLLAWAVPRMARWSRLNPALASGLVLCSPLMLANGVGGLHNDLLVAGLMAAALVVTVERGRAGWVWGAVLGSLAAGVKGPGGLVCVAVVLVSLPAGARLVARLRRLVQVAAVSLTLLVLQGLVLGTGAGWVAQLSVPASVNTPLSLTTLVGGAVDAVVGTGLRLLGVEWADATGLTLVRQVGTVLTLAVVAWVALRRPTGDPASAVASAALVLGATVVLSPVVHLWYLLWLPPFLATLRLSRVSTTGLVALSVVAGLVAPMDSSLHGAYSAIVLGSMTIAVLFPVLLMTPRARARVERIAAAHWPEITGVPARSALEEQSAARAG